MLSLLGHHSESGCVADFARIGFLRYVSIGWQMKGLLLMASDMARVMDRVKSGYSPRNHHVFTAHYALNRPVQDNSPCEPDGHSSDPEIGIERDRPNCSISDSERVGRSRSRAHPLVVDR